jgi:hypothetical protein
MAREAKPRVDSRVFISALAVRVNQNQSEGTGFALGTAGGTPALQLRLG